LVPSERNVRSDFGAQKQVEPHQTPTQPRAHIRRRTRKDGQHGASCIHVSVEARGGGEGEQVRVGGLAAAAGKAHVAEELHAGPEDKDVLQRLLEHNQHVGAGSLAGA
jgi:hypothetical protein